MNIRSVFKTAETLLTRNSTTILTGVGISGTVITALLSARGAVRADRILRDSEEDLTSRQVFDATWREFVPAVAVGSATVAAILMANRIGSARTAAAVAAFRISDDLSREYRDKVSEVLGKKTEEDIRAKVAKDRSDRNPSPQTIIVAGGRITVFDDYSGRYFESTPEEIDRAVNRFNQMVNNNFCASLSEFYGLLGLDPTNNSDQVGWNTDELLDCSYVAFVMSNSRPALSLQYTPKPLHNFDRVM